MPLSPYVSPPLTELLGSVLFSLALNFKQMALYYAPSFFFFLLASSVWGRTGGRVFGGELLLVVYRVCSVFLLQLSVSWYFETAACLSCRPRVNWLRS